MRLKTRLVSKIKELREKSNFLSQESLADAIGVTRQTISYIEKGEYNPSLKIAHDLSKYFKMSIDEIFDYEPVLKIEIEKSNLTREDLALILGIDVEDLKKLERGEYDTLPEFAEKLAEKLGCDKDDFFEDY